MQVIFKSYDMKSSRFLIAIKVDVVSFCFSSACDWRRMHVLSSYLLNRSASKFAVFGFAEALRKEIRYVYKKEGVKMTTVCPMFVNTNMISSLRDRATYSTGYVHCSQLYKYDRHCVVSCCFLLYISWNFSQVLLQWTFTICKQHTALVNGIVT